MHKTLTSFAGLLFLAIMIYACNGCKSKEPIVVYKTLNKDTSAVRGYSVNDPEPIAKGDTLRLIISLISKGEGIDRNAMSDINLHLQTTMSQTKRPLQYVLVFWGREGETDVCFRLKDLDAIQQQSFAEDMREIFANRPLVIVSENVPCEHIR